MENRERQILTYTGKNHRFSQCDFLQVSKVSHFSVLFFFQSVAQYTIIYEKLQEIL